MISKPQTEAPETEKEIPTHPLARFVTEEGISLLLNIPISEIKEIRCWPNVVLVIAEHLVRFVSYADFPPVLEVQPPTSEDMRTWRKRWKKNQTHQAPNFWKEFYAQKFRQSGSFTELYNWGRLLGLIKDTFASDWLESLRNIFRQAKHTFDSRTRTLQFAL